MKKGDKVYCINDLFSKVGKPKDTIIFTSDASGKSEEKLGDVCNDKCQKGSGKSAIFIDCPYISKRYLTKGKVYTISSIFFGGDILIRSDNGILLHFIQEKSILRENEPLLYILSDYFIKLKEHRKLKLDMLNETNFLTTLRNHKKKTR